MTLTYRHGSDKRSVSPSPVSPLEPISPWPPAPRTPTPTTSTERDRASSVHANSEVAAETSPSTRKQDELPTAKEIYGLIGVIGTYLGFAVYLVWAFTPDEWLHAVGWTWYPSREWAIIIPSYLIIIVLLSYFAYAAISAYLTPSFSSVQLITGIPQESRDSDPYYWKYTDSDATPDAVDLPLELVNRVLYATSKNS